MIMTSYYYSVGGIIVVVIYFIYSYFKINDKFYRTESYYSCGRVKIMDETTSLLGYLDEFGNILIEPQYNSASDFYYGTAEVMTSFTKYKSVIKNDFGSNHILKHRNHFQNAVTNGYESGGTWYDSEVDLMNETIVYGSNIFKNCLNGSNIPNNYTIDKSQLSLFRLRHDLTVALNDSGGRQWYWLRDVVSSAHFADVGGDGVAYYDGASFSRGVRPAFLIV